MARVETFAMKITAGSIAAGAAITGALIVAYLIIVKGKAAADAVRGVVTGAAGAVGGALNAVNPTNRDNVFSQAANAATQAVTGDSSTSLGTKVWEWLNPSRASLESQITAPTGGGLTIRASDLAATFDRDDAAIGQAMREFEYFNSADREDAERGANAGAAFIGYNLNVGRRK